MGNFMDGIDSDFIVKDLLIFGVSGQIRDNQSRNKLAVLLREITTLKNISKYIDFECDFGKGTNKNLCKRDVKWTASYTNGQIKRLQAAGICCCIGCADTRGHLRSFILESHLDIYNKLYKKVIGFWRPRRGCSLPRELRSSTCLYFNCVNSIEKHSTLDKMRFVLAEMEREASRLNKLILSGRKRANAN